jgi:hypothetical protein
MVNGEMGQSLEEVFIKGIDGLGPGLDMLEQQVARRATQSPTSAIKFLEISCEVKECGDSIDRAEIVVTYPSCA